MSKVKRIKIENFKAIGEKEMDFNGCTALITGRNNSGKTSFLRGIPDRIRFVRPDVMVKTGETKGHAEMTLDSGERFVWEFSTDKPDKLTYYSSEKEKRSVTVDFGAKFFPKPFDIDKFLAAPPKEQAKQLQKVIGVDFSDVEARYNDAYLRRKDKNNASEKYQVKLTEMMEVPKVDFVDIDTLQAQKTKLTDIFKAERQRIADGLNAQYLENKKKNDTLRDQWQSECNKVREEVNIFNFKQDELNTTYNACFHSADVLIKAGMKAAALTEFLAEYQTKLLPKQKYEDVLPIEPTYTDPMPDNSPITSLQAQYEADVTDIDNRIFQAVQTNTQAQAYKDYIDYKATVDTAKHEALQAGELVKSIEAERATLIASAKFPKGITIDEDGGILVDGFPLDRNQLSSSRITIAALQIAALNMGEVKTLFFDASYLDRNSLNEVNEWAQTEGLQLLIERPDFDGGEIEYQIIEQAI